MPEDDELELIGDELLEGDELELDEDELLDDPDPGTQQLLLGDGRVISKAQLVLLSEH
jgi:hypothetical protein